VTFADAESVTNVLENGPHQLDSKSVSHCWSHCVMFIVQPSCVKPILQFMSSVHCFDTVGWMTDSRYLLGLV